MAATTAAESTPPDRNAPYGTSDIIWRCTASSNRSVRASASSSSAAPSKGSPGGSRKLSTCGSPPSAAATSSDAGGSLDAGEQRAGCRHEAAGQVVVERHGIECGLHETGGDQGPDLRGEGEPAAVAPPVEGLDPEVVSCSHEPPRARVPEREGEDAVELAHDRGPVLLVAVDHDLAVRPRGEAVPAPLEARPQLPMVVDLAVYYRGDRAVLGVERLVASGDVDDRKPGAGQRSRPEAPERVAVGAAMAKCGDHSLGGLGPADPGGIEDGADAAHAPG